MDFVYVRGTCLGGRPYCRTTRTSANDDDDGKDDAGDGWPAWKKIYDGSRSSLDGRPVMHVHLLLTHKYMLEGGR